jgi:hypothetical protein
MERAVELRHLRYFIAVAEEGSLTLAAEKRAGSRKLDRAISGFSA